MGMEGGIMQKVLKRSIYRARILYDCTGFVTADDVYFMHP